METYFLLPVPFICNPRYNKKRLIVNGLNLIVRRVEKRSCSLVWLNDLLRFFSRVRRHIKTVMEQSVIRSVNSFIAVIRNVHCLHLKQLLLFSVAFFTLLKRWHADSHISHTADLFNSKGGDTIEAPS